METPKHADAAKTQPTPKEKLLHEIGQIIGEVRKKKEKLEKTLAEETRVAEEKRRQEEEAMAAFLKQGTILAVNLFGDKKEAMSLPFDKQTVVNKPEEYVKTMKLLFEGLEEHRREAERKWNRDNGSANEYSDSIERRGHPEYIRMNGYTPVLELENMRTTLEKIRVQNNEDSARSEEQRRLRARGYQYHVRGFSQAAIQMTIDKKKYDQYLNLIGVITNLLAIEGLQGFNRQFDGVEHIFAGMVRLIEEFNKEVVGKEQNPEKLGAIQEILDAIRKRTQGLTF